MRQVAVSILTFGCLASPVFAQETVLGLVSPIVLLDGRTIVACGARATTADGRTGVEVRLTRTAGSAELSLSGTINGEQSRISADTASILSSALFGDQSGPVMRTPADDPRVTTFIQELMVSGAKVRLERAGTEVLEASIAGPLPQSTRAAYLNCAGDLYRPGE